MDEINLGRRTFLIALGVATGLPSFVNAMDISKDSLEDILVSLYKEVLNRNKESGNQPEYDPNKGIETYRLHSMKGDIEVTVPIMPIEFYRIPKESGFDMAGQLNRWAYPIITINSQGKQYTGHLNGPKILLGHGISYLDRKDGFNFNADYPGSEKLLYEARSRVIELAKEISGSLGL